MAISYNTFMHAMLREENSGKARQSMIRMGCDEGIDGAKELGNHGS